MKGTSLNEVNEGADVKGQGMKKPATRIDVVVKLREREEDAAKLKLADAQRHAMAADEALRLARLRAQQDERKSGRAADWLLADAAHSRALSDAHKAESHAKTAQQQLDGTRIQFTSTHARAEAVRRLAETRRNEIINEAEARERKALDELATLAYSR